MSNAFARHILATLEISGVRVKEMWQLAPDVVAVGFTSREHITVYFKPTATTRSPHRRQSGMIHTRTNLTDVKDVLRTMQHGNPTQKGKKIRWSDTVVWEHNPVSIDIDSLRSSPPR